MPSTDQRRQNSSATSRRYPLANSRAPFSVISSGRWPPWDHRRSAAHWKRQRHVSVRKYSLQWAQNHNIRNVVRDRTCKVAATSCECGPGNLFSRTCAIIELKIKRTKKRTRSGITTSDSNPHVGARKRKMFRIQSSSSAVTYDEEQKIIALFGKIIWFRAKRGD